MLIICNSWLFNHTLWSSTFDVNFQKSSLFEDSFYLEFNPQAIRKYK